MNITCTGSQRCSCSGTVCIQALVDGLELCSFKVSEDTTELDGTDVKLCSF
jgi:hypothetical protein